ncbi:MAG: LON peptidase substrate-binding domain-containing protein [Deltaproteobacteria bacterium]|nr:LON peptidase substrate-binding domain-containing protein [Deltaproteobacteria bacterium]
MRWPRVIPIFPLPDVVLFPGVPLPLHIFEPRYCEMVRDASNGAAIIGMTLLRGDWQQDYYGSPPIFAVGCAGRMVSVENLADGRFNIMLRGAREFTIVRKVSGKSYRQAQVTWRPAAANVRLDTERRNRINDLLERFLAGEPETPARRLLDDESLSDELLVNFFSYAVEVPGLEKQALLEATSLAQRARSLCTVLEFHLEARRLGAQGAGASERYH